MNLVRMTGLQGVWEVDSKVVTSYSDNPALDHEFQLVLRAVLGARIGQPAMRLVVIRKGGAVIPRAHALRQDEAITASGPPRGSTGNAS